MFHHIHGKNIVLSSDNSHATRTNGFCQGVTFTNTPLTPLQRITFQIVPDTFFRPAFTADPNSKQNNSSRQNNFKKSKKPLFNGSLRIGFFIFVFY